MTGSVSISPSPPANKGLDYVYLREEGIRLVQQLSSDIWTDYNEHDPGVTTLEQLCYALTELSYRAELPLTELFADKSGDIQPRSHGMFIARRILPCNPVTVNDYRKLIIDRVPAIKNVWLKPRQPAQGSEDVKGLYDLWIYAPEADECSCNCELRPAEIVERVRRVYGRYRDLCEDIHSITVLKALRTLVYADVTIGNSDSAARVLAQILFSVGQVLAPEITRQPLSALLEEGQDASSIFDGPLLLRGFIDDRQLQPRCATLPVHDIALAVSRSEGVTGVRDLSVRTGSGEDRGKFGPNDSIPVPTGKFLHFDAQSRGAANSFTIRLYRNGVVQQVNEQQVEWELQVLWASWRRSYPLEAQYNEYFSVPAGEWRDLTRYYSIQNQYPNVYGIGSFGLPANSTPARHAQARQFKAYLLVFEQLMADYFAQLANVGNLFAISPPANQTYYSQSLQPSVPDIEPLLSPGYREGLAEIVAGEDRVVNRRNRFLDFLLSLYASRLNSSPYVGVADSSRRDPADPERRLHAQQMLLRLLVSSTRSRGRAFDYRAPVSPLNIAGMEIKCRIEMGLDPDVHSSLREALGKWRMSLARNPGDASIHRSAAQRPNESDDGFVPLSSFPQPETIPESSALLKGSAATEEFIEAGHDPDRLFIGTAPGDDTVVLASRTADDSGWIVIDAQPSIESTVSEAHALCHHLKPIHRARTQLYIVEHLLLRSGRPKKDSRGHFAYSFALSAVVGLPHKERTSRDRRTTIERIVRENTPSHIAAEICFLDPWALVRFEWLYFSWRSALRKGGWFSIALASARLRLFLERHRSV